MSINVEVGCMNEEIYEMITEVVEEFKHLRKEIRGLKNAVEQRTVELRKEISDAYESLEIEYNKIADKQISLEYKLTELLRELKKLRYQGQG